MISSAGQPTAALDAPAVATNTALVRNFPVVDDTMCPFLECCLDENWNMQQCTAIEESFS